MEEFPRKTRNFPQIQLTCRAGTWVQPALRLRGQRSEGTSKLSLEHRLQHCRNPGRTQGGSVPSPSEVLKEKCQSLENSFLECCHHPSVGWQNSITSYAECSRRSRTGNKSLLLSREVWGCIHHCSFQSASWLEFRELIKSMWTNPDFLQGL